MAIVRTVLMRLDDYVEAGVNVDDVAQEAVSAFFVNTSGAPVRVWFEWKNNSDFEWVSEDADLVWPIPPGQRKWVPIEDPDDSGELDTDFAAYTMAYQ